MRRGTWRTASATCDDTPGGRRQTQSTTLIGLAEGIELFYSPLEKEYATYQTQGHPENWPIKSGRFRRHLTSLFFDRTGSVPGSQGLQDALDYLAARAYREGKERTLHLRVGEHDGALYLDLVNPAWQAVKITPDGVNLIDNPPVKFRRTRGMLALPVPVPGGSVAQLRRFVNVGSDNNWTLMLSWLFATFRPRGPYPVLAQYGEQGSAKSTTARVLRELIDPNEAGLRGQPRDERDLVIAANNSHVIAYDNLSVIPQWFSDGLCRLATGGGTEHGSCTRTTRRSSSRFSGPAWSTASRSWRGVLTSSTGRSPLTCHRSPPKIGGPKSSSGRSSIRRGR